MKPSEKEARTATLALLASLPGAALAAAAAAMTTSVVLRADALLSLLDSAALLAVFLAVRGDPADPGLARRRERRARALTALALLCALAGVAVGAGLRLSGAAAPPQGPGLVLGLGLNLVQAGVNAGLLLGWRRRHAERGSSVAADQLCLFTDKLLSNVLILSALVGGVVFSGKAWAACLDPLAGVAVALVSAGCAVPVVARAWPFPARPRRERRGPPEARHDPPRARRRAGRGTRAGAAGSAISAAGDGAVGRAAGGHVGAAARGRGHPKGCVDASAGLELAGPDVVLLGGAEVPKPERQGRLARHGGRAQGEAGGGAGAEPCGLIGKWCETPPPARPRPPAGQMARVGRP